MKQDFKSENIEAEINQAGFKRLSQKDLKNVRKIKKSINKKETGIPKEVANRMARRIAITTGIPTISGMGVFIGSYYLITNGIADIAPVITLVTSGACFLVGLLGLSYGILSASWDKKKGSLLGIENIRPNINRMKDAFKDKNNSE
tara:strand:+ start:175 stop:612 length:438 start_codon:yes stop_codon:yes gene_type:complete